jgi:hypothetical protein
MTAAPSSKLVRWFTGRTRLITIVSIFAVGLAGAIAVSANIGILAAAPDSAVGNASVTGDLGPPSTQVVDVHLPATTAPPSTADAARQQFTVDVAGTVTVVETDAGLRLDHVAPAAGWTWSLAQSDPTVLVVTMTNATRTLRFTATRTADGNIAAEVHEPIGAPSAVDDGGGTRIDRDEDHDEHGDEHEEHEEYEGGEDDD